MKVCTDACLFGAWLAAKNDNGQKMLDIGSGTGLLSLMLAQKTTAAIDAVEIDEAAYTQTVENFAVSPWKDRLQVFNSSIQEYTAAFIREGSTEYDLIFSNPPFFENHLKSSDPKRNLALHRETLNVADILDCTVKMLSPSGMLALLVPYAGSHLMEEAAARKGFTIFDKMNVRQTPRHAYFRTMYLFCRTASQNYGHSELTIKNEQNNYSLAFSNLLEAYYLLPVNIIK